MGSQLRRAGEEALRQDVAASVKEWSSHIQKAGLILFSCPKVMMKTFFDDVEPVLNREDSRIHKVPLDIGRPTFEAVTAVHEIMMRVNLREQDAVEEEIEEAVVGSTGQTAELPVVVEKEKDPIVPLGQLHSVAMESRLAELIQLLTSSEGLSDQIDERAGEDFMTPLHFAAESASTLDPTTAAACVTALLVQGHANPCILDARHRTPYFLAAHEKVRDAFRMARATLGEEYCSWDEGAKVGPALTVDDMQKKKEKAAEKKRRQRARQKEKKAREKAQAAEMENKRREEEEQRKKDEDAKRIRDGLKPKTSTATNVCDYCQKVCKGKKRSQMLQRLDYAYCSTNCVQQHKRELMASAALSRLG